MKHRPYITSDSILINASELRAMTGGVPKILIPSPGKNRKIVPLYLMARTVNGSQDYTTAGQNATLDIGGYDAFGGVQFDFTAGFGQGLSSSNQNNGIVDVTAGTDAPFTFTLGMVFDESDPGDRDVRIDIIYSIHQIDDIISN